MTNLDKLWLFRYRKEVAAPLALGVGSQQNRVPPLKSFWENHGRKRGSLDSVPAHTQASCLEADPDVDPGGGGHGLRRLGNRIARSWG